MADSDDYKQHSPEAVSLSEDGDINTSGHVQELDRGFGFWSICSLAVASDNAWGAGSGALVVALGNGGGPGVLYGLIAATFFYGFIAACLAELASSMPTSANVYHWATVCAGPRYGRVASFFAGWWNALAWSFGAAGPSLFGANAIIAIYSIYHPDYTFQRWHIFIAYLGIVLLGSSGIMFGQRYLPGYSTFCGGLCLLLLTISFLIVVIMTASNGTGYAPSSFVWADFYNGTGWDSSGFVFLMGILNGAFTIGTPDGVCHLAEEVPRPRVNIPWSIVAQLTTGFLSTFPFYIVLLYGINDLPAITGSQSSLPLAAIYRQATGSDTATTILLVIFVIDIAFCIAPAYLTAGRMLWTLARDDAVPGSSWLRKVDSRYRNPFNAQLVVTIWLVILGCIYIGNSTAFQAFVGVFVILTTASYVVPFIANVLTARKYIPKGPFYMPDKVAYPIYGVAIAYILTFNVIYMFPFLYPVTADNMNYSCVMAGGLTLLLVPWYLWKRTRGYVGPQVALEARDDIARGIVGLSMAEEEAKRQRRLAHTS